MRISRDGLNFNEGGRFLTVYISRRAGFVRVWFQPWAGRAFVYCRPLPKMSNA